MVLVGLSLATVLLVQAWSTNADSHTPKLGGGIGLVEFRRQAELQGWEENHVANGRDELKLHFWLKPRRASELEHTLEKVSDPNSPRYGHYLSKEETKKMVAPTRQHLLAVREALQGLQLNESNQGAVISTKATVERATSILGGAFRYFCRRATPSVCVLRNPSAHVPATLRAACDVITPLDDPLPPFSPGPIVSATQSLALSRDNASSAGCCFSVGFGSLMQPCCLRTRLVDHKGACKTERRLGGAAGFHAGACPETPVQASRLLGAAPTHVATVLQMEGAADAAGCCFSIGFGSGMMPCCLDVMRVRIKAACHSGARTGGATGFRSGACPRTAADAAVLLNVTLASKAAGCCFSIGYGDRMRPCCLSSKKVAAPEQCKTDNKRIGGATAFHAGSCPASADEAAELIQQTNSQSNFDSDLSTLKEVAEDPRGCCFSIGYGDGMRPCCLSSKKVDGPEACIVGERLGGATFFHTGICPASADEAADLIKQKRTPNLPSVVDAQGCCYAIGYGTMMRPCCLQTELASNASMCQMSQRLGGAAGYSPRGCPISATQASGWLNEEAPEVSLSEYSKSTTEGRAIVTSLLIFVVSGILVAGALVFAWRHSAQDTASSFQAYESPNEEGDETRTPLRPAT